MHLVDILVDGRKTSQQGPLPGAWDFVETFHCRRCNRRSSSRITHLGGYPCSCDAGLLLSTGRNVFFQHKETACELFSLLLAAADTEYMPRRANSSHGFSHFEADGEM